MALIRLWPSSDAFVPSAPRVTDDTDVEPTRVLQTLARAAIASVIAGNMLAARAAAMPLAASDELPTAGSAMVFDDDAPLTRPMFGVPQVIPDPAGWQQDELAYVAPPVLDDERAGPVLGAAIARRVHWFTPFRIWAVDDDHVTPLAPIVEDTPAAPVIALRATWPAIRARPIASDAGDAVFPPSLSIVDDDGGIVRAPLCGRTARRLVLPADVDEIAPPPSAPSIVDEDSPLVRASAAARHRMLSARWDIEDGLPQTPPPTLYVEDESSSIARPHAVVHPKVAQPQHADDEFVSRVLDDESAAILRRPSVRASVVLSPWHFDAGESLACALADEGTWIYSPPVTMRRSPAIRADVDDLPNASIPPATLGPRPLQVRARGLNTTVRPREE